MRAIEVRCDNCGRVRPEQPRAQTWYLLEDHGRIMRTGPIDLCSLKCVREWSADPDVNTALPDLPDDTPTPTDPPDATATNATESGRSDGV